VDPQKIVFRLLQLGVLWLVSESSGAVASRVHALPVQRSTPSFSRVIEAGLGV
jgi:hypothetical protein